MSDPLTIALAASTAMGAVGKIQQGNAQAAAAGYNAKLMQLNATTAEQNAAFAGAKGEADAAQQAMRNRAKMGATIANQGASGLDINSGSAANVRESESLVGGYDINQIKSNAARTAYGYQTQAAYDRAESSLLRKQASWDRTAGYIGAATTLMGGAAEYQMFSANNISNLTKAPLNEGPYYMGNVGK